MPCRKGKGKGVEDEVEVYEPASPPERVLIILDSSEDDLDLQEVRRSLMITGRGRARAAERVGEEAPRGSGRRAAPVVASRRRRRRSRSRSRSPRAARPRAESSRRPTARRARARARSPSLEIIDVDSGSDRGVVRVKEEPRSGSDSDYNGARGRARARARAPVAATAAKKKKRKRGKEAPSRAQESREVVRVKEEPNSDGNGAGGRARARSPVAAAAKQRKRGGREAPSRAQESRVPVQIKEEPYSGSDSDGNVAGGRAVVPAADAKQGKRGKKTPSRGKGRRVVVRETSTPAAPSNGAPSVGRGKGRGPGRGRQRSKGAVRGRATPVNRVSTGVGSRTRSRLAEQGRAFAQEEEEQVEEREEEEEEEEQGRAFAQVKEEQVEEQEEDEEEGEEEMEMEVEVEVRSDDNDHGNGGIRGEGGGTDDVAEIEEEELGTDEDETSDDSDENFSDEEGDEEELEEEEEEEEEDDDDDDDEEEEEPGVAPDQPGEAGEESPPRSRIMAMPLMGKRMFEGFSFLQQVDTSTGRDIRARTRSNFKRKKLLDKKLLKRGTFAKPYCIDVSSSGSEEDVPQPEQSAYGGDCGDDDGGSDGNEEHRAVKRRKLNRRQSAHSDSEEDTTFVCDVKEGSGSRRVQEGAPRRQVKKEGSNKKKDGSTPQCVRNNGPKVGRQTNGLNGQGGVSFKRNVKIAQRRKRRRATADQEKYGHLLDPMFDEIESNQYEPVPEEQIDRRLPLVFAFGDDDKLEEKSKHDKLQDEDELWKEFDFALESINVCSHNCEEGEKEDEQEIPADKAASCIQGKHELIIDEQIGLRCKHCNFVDLEIRFVLPSMVKSCTERDMRKDHELDLFFDDILTSAGYEGPRDFGGQKTGLVWDLVPGVREDMFPHQQEGFEFMWRKLAGGTSIEQLRNNANTIEGGCVISHAPGTGKTRLAITFVQSYFAFFPECCPVIIAPRGMLATWEQEFRKWKVKVPFHVLNSKEINWKEDRTIKQLAIMDENLAQSLARNKLDHKFRRKLKLASWRKGSSIIGVSYTLFRKLANQSSMDGNMVRNLLLEKPDLLVLDEGHTPRNKKSLIWKVLEEVRTKKRIILSGTPFQNSFLELSNVLYLIRPKFARHFASKSFKKIGLEDYWTSLTLNNITEKKIDEIRQILDPIVHIHNGDILQKSLPGLRESVVILNPLPHQKEIITAMENTVTMGTLDAEYKISLASIHPFLVTCAKLSEKETSSVDVSLLKSLRPNPCVGVKTKFVLEIVRLCEAMKERVLVFSQYLEPLSLIMDQLSKMFNWTEGEEILLMSGNVLVQNREALMEAFNNMKSNAKVMLASTKACCEGITLIGASRVVLLDVVWNPSVGRQAIGRAYRIGQEKIVYTYNLITEGTKEKDKYDRQAKKDHMSKLLFSKEPHAAGFNLSQEVIFNDKILEAMTSHRELKDMFVKILHSH